MVHSLKILFNYFSGGGGGFSNILMLLRALAIRFPDDHIYICSAKADFSSLGDLPNVTVCPPVKEGHGEVARLMFAVSGVYHLASALDVDVIWSMNLGGYIRRAVPQVLSINNAYQVYPISVLRLHPAGLLRSLLLRFFSFLSILASDGVIVQTDVMRRQLLANFDGVERVVTSPKSVESDLDVPLADLSPSVLSALAGKLGVSAFTFLYVATAFPHKNHSVLVRAFEILKSRGVIARVVLTVDLGEILDIGGDMARELVERGYLLPVGWVPREQVRSLYGACDACLMPSLLESLSSAHLEAMAWGRAQIVTDLAYSRDLCGEAALYADSTSASDWAEKIVQLIGDQSLRARLVDRGLSRMEKFPRTWSDAAQITRDFLQSVSLGVH